MFGTIFESFHAASTQLMDKIRSALPEGATACRIRAAARESHRPTTGTLLETLGEEGQGMVFLDPVGMPLKYDQLQVYHSRAGSEQRPVSTETGWEREREWDPNAANVQV